ncbi:unnamed protein product [Nippostrongylus brasiliensis]|uniref:Uncharacterized protein n=1 Tax=Nippostrongylus brasiliensis TaxID=27835 RepID=A0A0N4YAY2_NIPBR|nr:unnamed protein product [Nippostrongylus brasiliensis]
MQTTSISTEMYNHIDSAIDYGCIFASGCPRQCTACGLCHSAKLRLFELLAGGSKEGGVECPVLHGCAKECVKNSNNNLSSLNHCLRHVCAYHCFNGSCPKCSSFIFKIFNQMCVAGNLRTIVKYNGQCPDLFREVVHAKFKKEFEFDRRLRR